MSTNVLIACHRSWIVARNEVNAFNPTRRSFIGRVTEVTEREQVLQIKHRAALPGTHDVMGQCGSVAALLALPCERVAHDALAD